MPISENYAGSGVGGLDQVLGGGFPSGQTFLIRGPSGAGKTTLGLQFLIEGVRNGEKVLYLGTSETEQEIHRVAESHGWSLGGVTVHHHEPPSLGEEQTMLHPAETDLPQTVASMLSRVEEIQPTRLVIDSLAEIRVLAQDELWYRRQLAILKKHFANQHCTVLLSEIPPVEQSTLHSIVSGVIELDQMSPIHGPDRRQLRVIKMRGQEFITGQHDFKIRKGGIEVFPRLVAAEHRHRFSPEQVSTGLPGLDAMLRGGFTRGTNALLLGPTGTAKSLLATQVAIAAAERGERSVMYIFDERVQTHFQRAAGVGLPLERHCDQGTIQIYQVDPAEMTSGEFNHLVKKAVQEDGIRVLVVDSLNGYVHAMPEERLLGVQVHELTSYLSQQGVTTILTVTQHGLVSPSIEHPFSISYIADTVILLRPFEFAGQVHKAISVYKNRCGPHESAIRELLVRSEGVEIGKPLRQFQGVLSGTPLFVGEKLNGHRDVESQEG